MKRAHPERELTKAAASYFRHCLDGSVAWTHFPAGEYRPPKTGALLKAMGLKAGWPDFQFLFGGRAYFIELKVDKGRLSENQKIAHKQIEEAGGTIAVCRSTDEIIEICKEWNFLTVDKISKPA